MDIETFIEENYPNQHWDEAAAKQLAIDYARYHVKEALHEALDEVPHGGSDEVRYEDVVGILTCYPPSKIK